MHTIHEANGLEGRDARAQVSGPDLDECLRQAMRAHMAQSQRSARDVALSLRMDEADFVDWLERETTASLDLLSSVCAQIKMSPDEVFSYSPLFRQNPENVVEVSQLLAKRVQHCFSESQLSLALSMSALVDEHPEAIEPINAGFSTAIAFAARLGFDQSRVQRSLERTAAEIRAAKRRAG